MQNYTWLLFYGEMMQIDKGRYAGCYVYGQVYFSAILLSIRSA